MRKVSVMSGGYQQTGFSHIVSHSAMVVLGRGFGAVAGFVTMLMIARAVDVTEFAQVSIGLSVAIILSFMCTFNIEAASVRFMTRYIENAQNARVLGYLRFMRHIVMFWGTSLTGAAVVLILLFCPAEMQATLIASAVCAPLLATIRVNGAALMGVSHPLFAILPKTFLRPLLFCLTCGLIISLVAEPKAYVFIGALALAAIIVLAVQYVFLQRFLQPYRGLSPEWGARKEWAKAGLIIGSNALYLEHGAALCILSASFVLQSQDLAQLDLALRVVGFLRFAQIGTQQVIMPRLARSVVAADTGQSAHILYNAALVRVVTCVLGLLILLGALPSITGAFGSNFVGAAGLIHILMGEAIILMIFGPTAALMSFSGTVERMFPVLLATIAFLVVTTMVSGAFRGAFGVAVVFVCARFLWDGTFAILAAQSTGLDPTLMSLFKRARVTPQGGPE